MNLAPFPESSLLPLSALQHLVFCERQCALIHIEQVWAENVFTVEGRHLHEEVDSGRRELRGDVLTARGVHLRSLSLGVSGIADVVEFHRVAEGGVTLPVMQGCWRPFPVEYKRGRRRHHLGNEVQLCAQAICLEEMLGAEIPEGALFYGKTQRRMLVSFTSELRTATQAASVRLQELFESRVTPTARREPKCDDCSLLETCKPGAADRSVSRYMIDALRPAGERS